MKYKAGDEVLIKAEITDISVCEERPYFVAPDKYSVNWVSEEKIIPMGKTYADGLKDAWELAKKIVCHEEQGGMSIPCFSAIFDEYMTVEEVLASLTAEEALAKIEAYEKEKEKLEVGRIVKNCTGGFGVVSRVEHEKYYVMWHDGSCASYTRERLINTGKTTDSLKTLLRQIGE